MRQLLVLAFVVSAVLAQTCNTGLPNNTLPSNGDVCDLLHDPPEVRTLCSLSISSGLQAALDACAADTDIEIMLSPTFSEAGPFTFPPVQSITLQGGGSSVLIGDENVVVGNRTALTFVDLVFSGAGTLNRLFEPPLRSNNLTMIGVLAYSFHGKQVVVQEACEAVVTLQVDNSYFFDNWGASLFHSGLYSYAVRSNTFDRCGGNQFGATFLKTRWGNQGTQIFFNNSQWVLFDEQPPLCISFLDGGEHLRCRDGVFECEDLSATIIAADCPRDVNKTFIDPATNQTVWEMLFEPYCRRYAPCQCEEVFFRDVSNVSVSDFSLRVGDVIYPYVTLPCVAGTQLVGGGAVGSVAPLVFKDPSFELGNNPPGNTGWTTSSGSLILDNSVTKPKSRTGTHRVICNGQEDSWFEQDVNFTTPGAYLVSFWGARRDDQRNNYAGGFVEAYIDGVQEASIGDPTFFDTLVADLTYYEFIFPPLNVAVPGVKTLRIRCNFVDTQNLEFAIDDIGSRASGLEIIAFPPGQGIGPPPLADPTLYIALPLTYDAYIDPLPCPPCPSPPDRPPDVPCDYVMSEPFTCFDTVFNGTRVCLEPSIFAPVGTASITDPSMEMNGTWTVVQGAPAIITQFGPILARTGTRLLYVNNFGVVAIEQAVTFSDPMISRLTFAASRGTADISTYQGKLIKLYYDGILMATLSYVDIVGALPAQFNYFPMFFPPVAVTAGVHTIRLQLDWSGGPAPSDLMVDDIQFLSSFASPSASRTPSPSPSPIPSNNTITVLCGVVNVTVSCPGSNVTLNCSGVNTTFSCYPVLPPPVHPANQLRCVDSQIYLGDNLYIGGCIVPADMMVPYQDTTVTANDCVTTFWDTCTLPSSFSALLDGNLFTCLSLQLGFMTCDCSTDKLINQTLNRTITADACAYEFDEIPDSVAAFFIRNNRAQQLDFGGCSRRITYDTVVASSVTPADFFDERAVGREILVQSNPLWGRIPDPSAPGGVRNGPRFLQDGLTRYRTICEDNCPQFNPTLPGTNVPYCIVDPTGADYVGSGTSGIYATIQEAIDDSACTGPGRAVWVRESENFYEEDLIFGRAEITLFGSDNATIVGTHFTKGVVEVLFWRGLNWVSNGKNGDPLIDIDKAGSLKNWTVGNCRFSGNGIKDAGVAKNRGNNIDYVNFMGNEFVNYQTTVLRFDATNIDVQHNTMTDCSGRLMQARYQGLVRVQHNKYTNSRGAPDIKKPAMFELNFIGRRDSAPCNQDPNACAVRRVIQTETESPFTSPDYKETGILLRDGAFYASSIRDNVVIKARTGFRMRKTDVIISAQELADIGANSFLEVFQFYNPQIRPSRFRREKNGEDFMIDGFFEGSRFSAISCSFPDCVPPDKQPRYCYVNLNFDSFYSEEYGWETYTNTTQAANYCVLPVINVTVFGGARIIPERIEIWRPHSNDIERPLLDEPSNEDILLGDAPVPNRFTVQGVDTTEDIVPLFASLLAANTTYGFGDGNSVYVRTDLTCTCPGINTMTGQTVNHVGINCTDIIGPFQNTTELCIEAAAGDTYTSCTVGPDSELQCTASGTFGEGAIIIIMYDCQLPVYLTIVTNGTNNTLVYTNETRYVVRTDIVGRPDQCVLETTDVYKLVFSEGTLNLCQRPAYYTVASTFRALNFSWEHLDFYLDYGPTLEDFEIEAPMLLSNESVIDLRFIDVSFNGQFVAVPARMDAVKLFIGLDVPDTLGRKQRNQRPPVYSILLFDNCTFSNFVFFETILNNSVGSADEQSEINDFPYVNALDIEFTNRLSFDPTFAIFNNVTYLDIDRTCLRVRFANYTRIFGMYGWHTGGRSLDTPAAYWVEANSASPNAAIDIIDPNTTQTREVTYPFLGDLTVPAYQTMWWITGLRDQAIYDCTQFGNATIDQCLASTYPSCCPVVTFSSAFVCGLPMGLRFVGEKGPLSQYILQGIPTLSGPLFSDDLSPLRELAIFNDVSIDGFICDIVLGAPNQDWEEENLCCKESCPPKTPSACRVNSSDTAITPANPWYNVYWFQDINLALQMCQAPSRRVRLEMPTTNNPYEVRLVASVVQPAVLVYTAIWTGPVTITVLSTFPTSGLISPPAVNIPITWTDTAMVPVMVEIVPGSGVVAPLTVEISGSMQMPPYIPEAVPTQTPPQWIMDISIKFTFCAPNNTVAPVSSFVFPAFSYVSPPINVNTPSFDYAAVLVIDWSWTATASLQTQTGATLVGIGEPILECNGHTPQGAGITVEDIYMAHADPCIDLSLDPITCPCTVPGLATWEQQDATPAPGLVLKNNIWDGRGYTALAIAGEFWNRTTVIRNTFTHYRDVYVMRIAPSATENCCALSTCENEFIAKDNTFLGVDNVELTGNLIWLGPTERAKMNRNKAVDAGAQEAVHPLAALFYVESCPGLPIAGSASENSAERVTGTSIQTRVPPNDCYWTVVEIDDLSATSSGGFTMVRNVQVLAPSGAPVCLRPIDLAGATSSSNCHGAVRTLMANNPGCDGTLADIWAMGCDKDVCLARLLGCPGTDPACNAATVPPCSNTDDCALCSGSCGRPAFHPPPWFIFVSAGLVMLLLCLLLCCCGYLLYLCVMAWPRKKYIRVKPPPAKPITTLDEKSALMAMMNAQK